MYKLIIVDDEYEHVQGIKNFIPWDKYDIEVCDVAYNGKDGLLLFEKYRPDIALIDIQMPFINGLTLMEEVIKLGQNVQMIIMSGHDNFDYARKAIDLQANNYLLKPCSAEEILQAVLRAKNMAMEENGKKAIINTYQTVFNQYISLFRDKMFMDLLDNKLRNPATFFDDRDKYHIDLSPAECCVAVFRLEDRDNLYTRNTNEEFDCLIISITEYINQKKSESRHFELVGKDGDIVLIASGESFDFDDFSGFIHRLFKELSDVFEYQFVVGIGKTAPSPIQASKSYNQALAVLENCIFLGDRKIAVYDGNISEESFYYLYPFSEEKKIFQGMEMGDSGQTKDAVNNFFRNFEQERITNGNFTKKIGITLLNSIMRFCSEKSIDSGELQGIIFKSFDEIINAKSFEALRSKLVKVIEAIQDHIHSPAPVNRFIQKALHYIHSHFDKDISLKTVADELYISPAYFSFLFKQEMKTNFIDYLNNYRISMAKELLKDVRLKNYEVAFRVGFQDDKYFFKIFKKYTGLTASQFRESINIFDAKL